MGLRGVWGRRAGGRAESGGGAGGVGEIQGAFATYAIPSMCLAFLLSVAATLPIHYTFPLFSYSRIQVAGLHYGDDDRCANTQNYLPVSPGGTLQNIKKKGIFCKF